MILTNERLIIHKMGCELVAVEAGYERASALQRAQWERLQRHADEGPGNPEILLQIRQLADAAQAEIDNLQKKRFAFIRQRVELEQALIRRAVAEVKLMRPHAMKALLTIREHIGLPIDEKTLASIMERTSKEIDAALEIFLAEIETKTTALFVAGPVKSATQSR
jgi:hypothetical protein